MVVAVCERIRDVLIRTGKVPASRVNVVYAGTDTSRFDPARWSRGTFRAEKSIPVDAFLLMQVGVRDWKGWRELIDSFAIVYETRPKVRLALISCRDDTERQKVIGYARLKGVADAVEAVEYRTDMPNVLAAADCVVDASWNGTGITGTIREAMSMARPVIATDCGGNRELVSSHRYGWLIPPRSRDALVAALNDVIAEPETAADVGRGARARVVEAFSQERRIDRLEEIYRDLVRLKTSA